MPTLARSCVPFLLLLAACGSTTSTGGGTADAAAQADVSAADTASSDDATGGSDVTSAADVPAVNALPSGDLQGDLADGDILQGDYTLSGALVIPADATVQILAGTTITSPSFSITVNGTLKIVGIKDKPVTISGPDTGKAWNGLRVAGTLTASWLDISYASINVQSSNATAVMDLDHCHVHHAQQYNIVVRGVSKFSRLLVESPRTASDMTYNIGVKGGTMTLEDSILQDTPNEVIITDSGANIVVHYNKLNTGHCGVHFNDTATAEVLHNEFKGNQYGLMLFGVAKAEIHDNNFSETLNQEIAETAAQTTKVNLTGNFWADNKNFVIQGAQPDASGELSAASTGVGPRPE